MREPHRFLKTALGWFRADGNSKDFENVVFSVVSVAPFEDPLPF
jgi:hypothetical protein